MGMLTDRVAVVTGGGRGIGRAIAHRYASAGATVVVAARTRSDLDQVVGEITDLGSVGLAVEADALTTAGARAPVEAAVSNYGRLDIVVNNVGGTVGRIPDPFAEPLDDSDAFERTLILNLTTAWWTSQAALPHLHRSGAGRIINIGSGASTHASGNLAYTSAKHGLVGLTRQLAQLTGRTGITVNCLCPGWTNTSLVDWDAIAARSATTADVARSTAEADNAQGRVLEPDEVAAMATFLASNDGSGVTGQVLGVDGGYRL